MREAKFYYKDANAPKPNKPFRIGASVLIQYNNRLLLEHRADSNVWGLVGGGMHPDESFLDCAIREVREETGILLERDKVNVFHIYDDPSRIASYPDGNIYRLIGVIFITELFEEPELVCSQETRELRFFTKKEIETLSIAASHTPIIHDYLYGFQE